MFKELLYISPVQVTNPPVNIRMKNQAVDGRTAIVEQISKDILNKKMFFHTVGLFLKKEQW